MTTRVRALLYVCCWIAFGLAAAAGVYLALRDPATAGALKRMNSPSALLLFAGACVANTAGLVFGGLSWRELLIALGSRLPVPTALRISSISALSKYIPGPIWGVVAEVKLGRTAGVSSARVVTHYVLYLALVVLAGLTVGLGVAPAALGIKAIWLLLPVAAALGCLLRPAIIGRWVSRAARLLHRPVPTEVAAAGGVRRAFALEAVAWAVAGLHLWLIAIALGAAPLHSLPIYVAAFPFSAVIGALVVVVPDGLGVREVVLVLVLRTIMPWQTAAAAAVLSRVCCMVCEIGMAGASMTLDYQRSRRLVSAVPEEAR
jgi:uncharacterized membrane protein YbhN (UPF0104 family)